jgi:DNA-binding MarR family transcriptional regulator
MVVNSSGVEPAQLDLAYLGLFLGLRVNQLVVERFHAAGFRGVRESHGYLIQHLIEKERSISELARRMEVSQQAASKVVAGLAALGVLEIAAGPDRRQKTIRLSRRGWKFVNLARETRREIADCLVQAAGAKKYKAASAVLSTCLEALGGMERVRIRRIPPPQ